MNGYKTMLMIANERLELEKGWAKVWKLRENPDKFKRAIHNAMQIEQVIAFINEQVRKFEETS